MKKTVFYLSIYFTALVLSFGKAHSQSNANIGILPVYNHQSKNIFFIDCDAGEIKSFAVLSTPVSYVAVNQEENVFYALTRHHIYKGSVKTGEVLDEFQFMEELEQKPGAMMDPNLNIHPYGVTKNGQALFLFNEELYQITSKRDEINASIENASNSEIMALSEKSMALTEKTTLLYNVSEAHFVDFNTKSKKDYGTFDNKKEQILGVEEDGKVKFYDKINETIIYRDIITKEIVGERSTSGLYDQYPEFKELPKNTPSVISEDLISYTFMKPLGGGIYILFNTKTNEPILYKEFVSAMSASYPLYYKNTTNYIFADKSCDIGPMPAMPDFGEPDGISKKKIAVWQEEMTRKQNEHQKALKEWQDKAINPENCSITIFEDDELEEVKMEIPNASFAMIYNNIYAIVNRNFEIVLYNLESKEQEWVIDTDF